MTMNVCQIVRVWERSRQLETYGYIELSKVRLDQVRLFKKNNAPMLNGLKMFSAISMWHRKEYCVRGSLVEVNVISTSNEDFVIGIFSKRIADRGSFYKVLVIWCMSQYVGESFIQVAALGGFLNIYHQYLS